MTPLSDKETPKEVKLKICPFCDGEAFIERHGTARQSSIIKCEDCGLTLESNESVWNTGSNWNQRSREQLLEKALVEAREALILSINDSNNKYYKDEYREAIAKIETLLPPQPLEGEKS